MWKLHQERKFVDDIAYDLIRTQFTLALGAGSLVGRVSIRFRGAGEVTCDRFRQGLQRMEAVAGGAEGRAQQVHTRDRAAGDGAERASLCAVQADAGGGRGGGGKHEVPVWGGVSGCNPINRLRYRGFQSGKLSSYEVYRSLGMARRWKAIDFSFLTKSHRFCTKSRLFGPFQHGFCSQIRPVQAPVSIISRCRP